jgi:hypothetical protein
MPYPTYTTTDGELTAAEIKDAIRDGWGAYDAFAADSVIAQLPIGQRACKATRNSLDYMLGRGELRHLPADGVYSWGPTDLNGRILRDIR